MSELDKSSERRMTERGKEIRRCIEECERLGEPDTAIAVRLGVKKATVGWWRRRIRRLMAESGARESSGAVDFVPVHLSRTGQITAATPPKFAAAFVVEIGAVRVEVPSGFCGIELRQLMVAVRPC